MKTQKLTASPQYFTFINGIVTSRGQWNVQNQFFEVHHIIPVCCGGKPTREQMTETIKYSKHPNLIWLLPEEHYEAHRLLALENPDNYGLFASWLGTTKNNTLSCEDYMQLKLQRELPEHIKAQIQQAGQFGYMPRQAKATKTSRKPLSQEARMARANYGKANGMFGNGAKISGGKNGHASVRYFYEDRIFECRNDLLEYLWGLGIKITSSAIRKVIHNTGTARVYHMYKDVFDKLRWEFKYENTRD